MIEVGSITLATALVGHNVNHKKWSDPNPRSNIKQSESHSKWRSFAAWQHWRHLAFPGGVFFFFLSEDTWITRPSVFRPQMLTQWGYQRMGQKFKARYKEFSHFWCHPFISNRPNFDPYPSGMKQLRFKHLNFMFLCCNQLPLIVAHGNP